MGSLSSPSIRRVAIVGAGPGGVVAAKYLRAEDYFETIDIFEQQESFGGVWNYSPADQDSHVPVPQTNPHPPLAKPMSLNGETADEVRKGRKNFVSPMYDSLETNIPHVLMKHPDAPSLEEHQLFPTRKTVVEYLEEFAKDMRNVVQFQTRVVDIKLRQGPIQDIWMVSIESLASGEVRTMNYDAVLVCNGHYSVPSLPNIRGIRDWDRVYPRAITHSKLYRTPASYADKKVVIVGNSASGADIASQISTVAKHPVLNSTRSESPLSFGADWKKQVPEIAEFLPQTRGNRAVLFKDGRVETGIDAVLFCTGYFYSFPFLSSLVPKLIDTGERVQHLYRHLFYIDHPSLAFIGLPSKIIPFRTFEGQAAVIARTWAERLALPSVDQMNHWEVHEIAERGRGRQFHVLPFPKDFEYHNSLVDWALKAKDSKHGRLPAKWSEKETWQVTFSLVLHWAMLEATFISCSAKDFHSSEKHL